MTRRNENKQPNQQTKKPKNIVVPQTGKFRKVCEQVVPIYLHTSIKIQVSENSWKSHSCHEHCSNFEK